MKNKKVLRFDQWVNESYNPVNEGGGAGVDIRIDRVTVNARYVVSDGVVTQKSYTTKISDSFDASGYEEGMSGVSTRMLEVKDAAVPAVDKFLNLPLKFNYGVDKESFMEDLGVYADVSTINYAYETVGDLLSANPKASIEFAFNIEANGFGEMRFGGYTRGKIGEGDVVINEPDVDGEQSVEMFVSSESGDEYEIYGDEVGDLANEILPSIIATDEFEQFWNDVFVDVDKNYTEFCKEEIKQDVADDELDDEIQEYLDQLGEETSVDEFKLDIDQRIDDFCQHIKDTTERYWDIFLDQRKMDYEA